MDFGNQGQFFGTVCRSGLLGLAILFVPSQSFADGNPQNPSNWTALPPIVQGDDTFVRKEYESQNGVQVTVTATYFRNWVDMVWNRNGVAMPGQEIVIPFGKQIYEADTLDATSEGEVKVRMQWNQSPTYPAPNTVRVKITSPAYTISALADPIYIVDNGLNSPEVLTEDGAWLRADKLSPEIRTVKVSNGIAEFKLTKNAWARRIAGNGITSSDVVWADAHAGTLVADPRNATILLQGGEQWKRSITGQNVVHNSPITWQMNTHHNWFVAQSPVYFSYPGADKVVVPIEYESPSVNSASYLISAPTRYGYNHGSEPPGHLPECWFDLYFVGFATSEHIPIEQFQWTDGPSGNLPDPVFGWNFPSKIATKLKHHLTQWDQAGEKWAVWSPTLAADQSVTLRYTWSDGVFAESVRSVAFCEPRADVASTAVVDDDHLIDIPLQFQEHGFVVPIGHETAFGIFTPTSWSKSAAITVSGTVSAVLGTAAFWQPWLAIPAGIGAALGMLVEFMKNESDIREVLRAGDPLFCWWHTGGEISETAPPSWNVDDWKWSVNLRPATKKQLTAYDKWAETGYVGRFVESNVWEQAKVAARRLRHYYPNGDGGGQLPGGG